MELDQRFRERVIAIAGEERGRAWLAELPGRVYGCAETWNIVSLGHPIADSYHFVAFATLADGRKTVLKLCAPQGDADREYEAMIAFQGPGFVRLLDRLDSTHCLLMERIEPGTDLAGHENDAEIAAQVFKAVHRPAEGPFPNLNRWGAALWVVNDPIPMLLLDKARALWRQLVASSAPPVLCHGDLHHFNILDGGEKGWIAIDPKGVFAEPAFETGAFLRNQVRDTERRIATFAESLSVDRRRIRDWAFAQAVLSACWSVQDGDSWEEAIQTAELLLKL